MNIKFGLQNESYKLIKKRMHAIGSIGKYEDEITQNKEIDLICAKRDSASFQVIMVADTDISVTLGDSPYFSAADVRDNIRVEAEFDFGIQMSHIGFVKDDDSLYKSDILLNNATVETDAHNAVSIWAEAKIGEDVFAGTYHGKINIYHHRVFAGEEYLGSLKFSVQVYDVLMPKIGEGKFYLDLWQHNANIARKHEVALYSDKHFEIIEKYLRSLGELGQSVITVVASEIPWSGQFCYLEPYDNADLFEYNMIKIKRDISGNFSYDFSVMQRYIDLCFKYGINKEIEVFGFCRIWVNDDNEYKFMAKDYPEYIRLRYFDEADRKYKYIDKGEDIKAYIKALGKYFEQKGYIDIVRIVADEPADMEMYHKSVNAVNEAYGGFKYKTAVNHGEFIREFKDKISDFVPGMFCISENHELLKDMAQKHTHRILWYVCCSPKVPNTFVSSNLLEARAIGYITKFMGFEGFLRWSYTIWPKDPRADMRFRYPNWRCGDTALVYPSYGGEVLMSIRYKALRRGILDFELMSMCEQNGGKDILKRAFDKLIKVNSASEFGTLEELNKKEADEIISIDFDEYESVKREMLEFLKK